MVRRPWRASPKTRLRPPSTGTKQLKRGLKGTSLGRPSRPGRPIVEVPVVRQSAPAPKPCWVIRRRGQRTVHTILMPIGINEFNNQIPRNCVTSTCTTNGKPNLLLLPWLCSLGTAAVAKTAALRSVRALSRSMLWLLMP